MFCGVPLACQSITVLALLAVLAGRRISNLLIFSRFTFFDPHLQHQISY
jgi:hypothetical protein